MSLFQSRQFIVIALFAMAGNAAAQTASNVTANFSPWKQVVEPVTIAQNWNGGEWFATAFMDTTPRLNVSYKSTGAWSTPQLLSTTNTTYGISDTKGGDPVLVENQTDSGINPRKMYVVGLSFTGGNNAHDNTTCTAPNRVAVWTSGNGGQSWSDPVPVHTNATGAGYFDDKPAALVSKYSSTAGLIYVAFNRTRDTGTGCSGSGPLSTLHFYSFNPATATSTFLSTPISGTIVTDPVIFENPSSGELGLAWMNFDNHSIDVTTSTDGGYHWATVMSYPDSYLLPPGSYVCETGTRSQQCVSASLGLTGRFNPTTGQYGLAWHHRRGSTSDTGAEVIFALFSPGVGFSNAIPVSPYHSTHFTWQPAIDVDSSGNFMVSYYDYDEAAQPGLFTYYIAATKRTGSGLWSYDSYLFDNTWASVPSLYGTLAAIGEYHDIFFWNGYFNVVGVYMENSRGDVWHVRFQP